MQRIDLVRLRGNMRPLFPLVQNILNPCVHNDAPGDERTLFNEQVAIFHICTLLVRDYDMSDPRRQGFTHHTPVGL